METRQKIAIGDKFGRWTVTGFSEKKAANGVRLVECVCVCGNTGTPQGAGLRRGSSKSCGCLQNEMTSARKKTHGMSKHRLFPVWVGMMRRCHKPSDPAFPNYGARGITVCDRWHDVSTFIEDAVGWAPGLSIDRIDNNKGYSPDNCRWATRGEQNRNTRSNVMITHDGITLPIFDWAERIGMPPRTLWSRIRAKGWPVKDALTMKSQKGMRRASLVDHNGITDTLSNHARKAGVPPHVVAARISRSGWTLDQALNTPVAKRLKRLKNP